MRRVVVVGFSALNRGVLKRKGGRCTIHFTAESPNVELLFRTIHSIHLLSMYGAVSSWCRDLAQLSVSTPLKGLEVKALGRQRIS